MSYVYGSGTLGSYLSYAHGTVGNFATADVGIIGDSITTRGYPELSAALSLEGKTLAVDYWSSRPTTPAVTTLLTRPTLPKILVMACGTNDIFDPMVMSAQIDRVKNYVFTHGVVELVWMDVFCCRTIRSTITATTQMYDMRNTGLVNNQIHDAFEADHIVDWYRWLNYRGITFPLNYLDDGVHPKINYGTKFWADIIMRKIRPFFT